MATGFTIEQAREFQDRMVAASGAVLVDRATAMEIWGIAVAFDVLRAAKPSMGLPSGTEFRVHFSTTLGNRIYLATSVLDKPVELATMLTHEIGHVHQFDEGADPDDLVGGFPWPSEIAFPILYLKDKRSLVKWECDCYAAGESVCRRLGGRPRTVADIVHSLSQSYNITTDAASLDVADKSLAMHWEMIRKSGRTNVWAAVTAHNILDEMGVPASL